METAVIAPEALEALVVLLKEAGYRVVGPTVQDGAIVYEELESADDLPIGWTDTQEAGHYRLERRGDEARFGYAVGPHSWKQFLFPPRVRLWQAAPRRRGLRGRGGARRAAAARALRRPRLRAARDRDPGPSPPRGAYADRDYAARREGAFIVAVNCTSPAAPASASRWAPARGASRATTWR